MIEHNRIQMLVLLSVGIAGCATWGGYGGRTAQLTTYAASRSEAIMNSTREAERYCKEHGGGFVRVVREETVYHGQLDEQIGTAAQTVGRVAAAMGNAQAGQVGAAIGSPSDYKTTVQFVCQ